MQAKEELLRNVTAREHGILRSVYGWMTVALALTALVAFGVAVNPALVRFFLFNPMMLLMLVIAEFVMVIVLSARLERLSKGAAVGLFLGYAALNGVMFSSVFLVYDLGAVFKAFATCSVMFLCMTIYASTTKRDLNSWGYYLSVSLMGLLIASLMNMFFRSGTMDYILSCIGVVIFMGLTAWDTQNVVRVNDQYGGYMDEEMYDKLGVVFALNLYLDFLNMFLYVLRLFNRNKD